MIETARLLGIDEARVYRWAEEGAIPHYEVDGQYRFHRAELLEWATAQGLRVSAELFRGSHSSPSLAEALAAGVVTVIEAPALAPLLDTLVERLPITEPRDRPLVAAVLRARRVLETTIGDGISLPRARQPIALRGERASITIAHAVPPIARAFRSGDALRVMFAIVSPTPRVHLELLSALSSALQTSALRAAVLERAPMTTLVAEAERAEAEAAARGDATAGSGGTT
ncbi:helix-turn-helix domain-containing protein [Myxococcota bacterium]|nr:helix-turn-helix domain-containing protein [Myxococcota bacterium]